MLIEHLAIIVAALFAGAAIYINVAEQPARLALPDAAMLIQWQRSYSNAAKMQAGLALLGGILGLAAFWLSGAWLWVLGALVLLSAWPFTLIVIKPDQRRAQRDAVGSGERRDAPLGRKVGQPSCWPQRHRHRRDAHLSFGRTLRHWTKDDRRPSKQVKTTR